MSRDWTPAEHYMAEQERIKEGRGDIFSFMEGLRFVQKGEKEQILHSLEEMAVRRQFPLLGKLLMNNDFMVLHEKLSYIPGGIDFLHKKDNELAKIIETQKADEESYLFKWFVGKLDEGFYYSERNNQMFVECLLSDAMALNREVYDVEKFEAALNRFARDINIEENQSFYECHANKLIYCSENKKDILDFEFWARYELLLGEKITWDEYVAIDNRFDGDPHDVELSNKRTINTFKTSLKRFRAGAEGKASLEANIHFAENMRSDDVTNPSHKRTDKER